MLFLCKKKKRRINCFCHTLKAIESESPQSSLKVTKSALADQRSNSKLFVSQAAYNPFNNVHPCIKMLT